MVFLVPRRCPIRPGQQLLNRGTKRGATICLRISRARELRVATQRDRLFIAIGGVYARFNLMRSALTGRAAKPRLSHFGFCMR